MRRKPHAGRRLHGRQDGHPWRRHDHDPAELARALVAGRVAGPETSHDRRNVRWKIERLCEGDPDLQFGIRGLAGSDPDEVLRLMADAAGFDPDPGLWDGPTPVDPWKVLTACDGAGGRLALAAEQGERVLLATGHPAGLPLLYAATGELLVELGAKLLRPLGQRPRAGRGPGPRSHGARDRDGRQRPPRGLLAVLPGDRRPVPRRRLTVPGDLSGKAEARDGDVTTGRALGVESEPNQSFGALSDRSTEEPGNQGTNPMNALRMEDRRPRGRAIAREGSDTEAGPRRPLLHR